jgi:DNA-binding CsgD family transcriptional regulator
MRTATSSSDPQLGRDAILAGNGARLSKRDRALLTHISRGLSDARIAEKLDLSPEALRATVRHIVRELGARNRTHAVTLALRSGQIR